MKGITTITEVAAATIRGQLPAPVIFGDWIMRDREFVVVRVTSSTGHQGWSFTLTRDGAVAEQIRRTIASVYVGTDIADRVATYFTTWRRSPASHSTGVGLRALSIVDLAVWDLAARIGEKSITELLGGSASRMKATAIVGYPPALIDGPKIGSQVRGLVERGWNRFKAPIAPTNLLSLERLRAIRDAAPNAWVGCDAAWLFANAKDAYEFLELLKDIELGWFEDIFPPGELSSLVELKKLTDVPIAMGDEQGGSYYPEALINTRAVDVIRIDLTCMGGISGGRQIIDMCLRSGINFAPHMFAHVHSQIFAAWGFTDCPIEWGVPWTGVDPYADSLEQPRIDGDGLMRSLHGGAGFGSLINHDWALSQPHDDPQFILGESDRIE